MTPAAISIDDFDYDLPEDKIALFPPDARDGSKLLVYKQAVITESSFTSIDQYLDAGTLVVFNDSKVINARLAFKKATGGVIEIFCLEPAAEAHSYKNIFDQQGSARWKCFVGKAASWKEGIILTKQILWNGQAIILSAIQEQKLEDAYLIRFSWEPADLHFDQILKAAGKVPLPPYIKRDTDEGDDSRYQTIYAKNTGSVAAPTAGLHFTETVFKKLEAKNIDKGFVTLHVGAGTFKPVKADVMEGHEMHAEYIDVTIEEIENIQQHPGKICAAGTTSLRTLESLYWLGVKADPGKKLKELAISQWEVYDAYANVNISASEALQRLINYLNEHDLKNIFTRTQILIAPGYRFRIVNMLVTNFHQPRSTLLLLVAAAIGDDWKTLYSYALNHDFRFLSYGDANLIFINDRK